MIQLDEHGHPKYFSKQNAKDESQNDSHVFSDDGLDQRSIVYFWSTIPQKEYPHKYVR